MISNRIKNMKPSETVVLTAKVAEIKKSGVDVIAFNIGEPDFNTPENIINKGKEGFDKGKTKYTPAAGSIELRESICRKLKRDNHLEYGSNQIIVTTGAKQALTNVLLTICDKEDEVIVLSPCWVSYIEMIKLAEAKPVIVALDEDNGFMLDVDKIKKAITKKTKAIIINTPNNPTGTVYKKEDLERIGKMAVEKNIIVIADEIYEKLVYDEEEHISVAAFSSEIKEQCIVINGVSKAFAMTGWRIGYAAGPLNIIKGMSALQGHTTSNANSDAQYASIEALDNSEEFISVMIKEFDIRRKYLLKRLNAIDNISAPEPKGAFYIMARVTHFFGMEFKGRKIKNAIGLADFLLEEAHIAVVPGDAFESPNNIRIAYSNSIENIKLGMDRMEEALKKLK